VDVSLHDVIRGMTTGRITSPAASQK